MWITLWTSSTSQRAADEAGMGNALVLDKLSRIGEQRRTLRFQACICWPSSECKAMKTGSNRRAGGCPVLLSVSTREGESGESLA